MLEETRQCHEDVERLERLIVKEFRQEYSTNGTGYKQSLQQLVMVQGMLERIQEVSGRLVQLYEDGDGRREEEIHRVLRGADAFEAYYRCVDSLKEFYSSSESHSASQMMIQGYDEGCDGALVQSVLGGYGSVDAYVKSLFSGEEVMGRYLDLMDVYRDEWMVLYGEYSSERGTAAPGEAMSYEQYVCGCMGHGHMEDLDALYKLKRHGVYIEYLEHVVEYLGGFYRRIHPLKDWDEMYNGTVLVEFERQWGEDLGRAWKSRVFGLNVNGGGEGEDAPDDEDGCMTWESCKSAEELEETLGGEKVKAILASMGLKCGGTVQQRCERLLSVKGKSRDEIDPSLFAGKKKKTTKKETVKEDNSQQHAAAALSGDDAMKRIACLEFCIKYLCTVLLERQWKATMEKLEKRKVQTYEEFVADMHAEMEQDDAVVLGGQEDENEDEYSYNPLKLPLGWDGKPIPYWMYKLHGLNHEYKCEICGNATYWGRRPFEKHFTEARHVAGMKALGIPNTRQFFEITSIAEAVNLWNTLKSKETAEDLEEFEDAEGNIYDKTMFLDLQKQGML